MEGSSYSLLFEYLMFFCSGFYASLAYFFLQIFCSKVNVAFNSSFCHIEELLVFLCDSTYQKQQYILLRDHFHLMFV